MLVASGDIEPGTVLHARDGDTVATVTAEGRIDLQGKQYDSPSGAGRALLGRTVNGWYFWRLPDGRRLIDVRNDYARKSSGGLLIDPSIEDGEDMHKTRERGLRALTTWLTAQGWQVSEGQDEQCRVLVAKRDAIVRTMRFSARSAGDWQVSILDGEPLGRVAHYWALIDVGTDPVQVRIYAEDEIRQLIGRKHAEYLARHGGRRAHNDDSPHAALRTAYLGEITESADWYEQR